MKPEGNCASVPPASAREVAELRQTVLRILDIMEADKRRSIRGAAAVVIALVAPFALLGFGYLIELAIRAMGGA